MAAPLDAVQAAERCLKRPPAGSATRPSKAATLGSFLGWRDVKECEEEGECVSLERSGDVS